MCARPHPKWCVQTKAWGAQFIDHGACGHINADSGLGDWPEGRALLRSLVEPVDDDEA